MEEITYKGKNIAIVNDKVSPKTVKVLNKKLFNEMKKQTPKSKTVPDQEDSKSSVFKKMFSWL